MCVFSIGNQLAPESAQFKGVEQPRLGSGVRCCQASIILVNGNLFDRYGLVLVDQKNDALNQQGKNNNSSSSST